MNGTFYSRLYLIIGRLGFLKTVNGYGKLDETKRLHETLVYYETKRGFFVDLQKKQMVK